MPTPQTEEPERFPGGPDALDERYGDIPDGPVGADLPPDLNPVAVGQDAAVPEISEPDDKSQEPEERPSGEGTDSEPSG